MTEIENLDELRRWFDEEAVPATTTDDLEGFLGFRSRHHIEVLRDMARTMGGNGWNLEMGRDAPPAPLPQIEGMDLIPYCASDGEIEGFMLICWTKHDFGACQLLEWLDTTDDSKAEGIEGAWAIVTAIAKAWLDLMERVTVNVKET